MGTPVSYTHLDVYKRQSKYSPCVIHNFYIILELVSFSNEVRVVCPSAARQHS